MAARNYGRKYLKDEDFEEEDIWGVMDERENNSSPKLKKSFKNSSFYNSSSSSSYATKHASPRMIPRSSSSSSLVAASEKQSSAPVAIPDWSKIYGKTPKNNNKKNNGDFGYNYNAVTHNDGYYGNYNNNGFAYDNGHHHDHHANGCYDGVDYDDDDVNDDDDDGMLPPHEFLARKLARSQISSFSVYEGIGRTLKGRDLSKVRNAILTKTGFLE